MAILENPQRENLPKRSIRAIPDGADGIRATVDEMVRMTREYRTDPIVRSLAESIVAGLPNHGYWAEVEAIRKWVQRNIRYTMDVFDVETLKTPLALLRERFGDCDDMTTLTGTLLQSIGHPVRYVAVGPEHPENFEHVYLRTKIGNRWIGVETTEDVPLGWEPPNQVAFMQRNV